MVELGNFEDTVDRLDQKDFNIPKGSRSSMLLAVVASTVGVYFIESVFVTGERMGIIPFDIYDSSIFG